MAAKVAEYAEYNPDLFQNVMNSSFGLAIKKSHSSGLVAHMVNAYSRFFGIK